MSLHALSSRQFTDADYVCVAAHVLAKMMSEHESLEVSNQRITLAMAAAGHDLRQRLHMLLGTVEILASAEDELRKTQLRQRAKSLIFRLAGELEQLALQAQCEHNRASPSPQCVLISTVLGRLIDDWGSAAAAKHLRFRVDQADLTVESDPHLLAVILNNVVGNAITHTAEGGVTVAHTIEGPLLVIAVSDTGPGISEEHLRRSFSLSCRLGRLNEGMGLGLSIARKSAEMLGHEFEVSTVLTGGTCVRLYVPLAS
jgi:signal transduction histidine kinase